MRATELSRSARSQDKTVYPARESTFIWNANPVLADSIRFRFDSSYVEFITRNGGKGDWVRMEEVLISYLGRRNFSRTVLEIGFRNSFFPFLLHVQTQSYVTQSYVSESIS